MYTLRIIEETRADINSRFQKVTENFHLGKSYAILENGLTDEFDEVLCSEFSEADKGKIRSLVCGGNGDKYFVEKDTELERFTYYIMEIGQTIERL